MNWALDGNEWSASRCSLFTPGKEPPGIHPIGGHMGPSASLDETETAHTCDINFRNLA
jgi:hypothetical protein